MSFVKLKNKFFVDESDSGKNMFTLDETDLVIYGPANPTTNKFPLVYSDIILDSTVRDQILSIIPKEYRSHFGLKFMNINYNIGPHIDTGVKTGINFYLKADKCITQFYKFKIELDHEAKKTLPTGVDLNPSKLNRTVAFVAEDNDVYCLDITQPHSVYKMVEHVNRNYPFKCDRTAISCTTVLPYDLVCDLLKQTGSID